MGSFIASMIVGIFDAIGGALAGAFLAELSLVQDFVNNTHIVFGGSFNQLLGFNAVVIPGLAILVALIWLATKGLTGGNSKTSTEDIFKRVLGALVVSFVLSLIVNPVEGLIGALDSSLMSLVNVNSQGLQHAFSGIATVSAIGGIEDSIFISIVILFIGILIAGALILILILAHAAVFLLVYFAPYLTLFRKEGFREAVEGVVAALSMPFIVTSILAVGIATMGATGTTSPSALGTVTTLSAMVGSHLISLHATLTSSTTSISAVNYFTNAIGGLLILGAAVFLPKFILGMVFQAGTAMHDAFRSGHQQLASTVANHASPSASGKEGKIARLLHSKLGRSEQADASRSGSPGTIGSRGSLADQAFSSGKASTTNVHTVPTPPRSTDSTPRTNSTDVPGNQPTNSSSNAHGSTSPVDGPPSPSDPENPAADTSPDGVGTIAAASGDSHPRTNTTGVTGELPKSAPPNAEPSTSPPDGTPPTQDTQDQPADTSPDGVGTIAAASTKDSKSDDALPPGASKKTDNSKPLTTKVAHFTADHYKGTVRAIPQALSSMPRISPESPIHTTIEARSAWRAAKRQNIRQVREERVTDEKENPRDWRKKDSGNKGSKIPETKEPELDESVPPDVENTHPSSQTPPNKKDS